MYENGINPSTPLATMTCGQFIEQLAAYLEHHPQTIGAAVASAPEPTPARRYVYGLRGIMQLFNVSNMTAQRYKRTIIKDAVSQNGRKIVVDAEKALELFAASMEDK